MTVRTLAEIDSGSLREGLADPLAKVLALGERELRVGVAIGIVGACLMHGFAAYKIGTSLFYLADFARGVQGEVLQRIRATVDIDPTKEPTPPPAPDPVAEVKIPTNVPRLPKGAEQAPPAAAEAGKLLAQEPTPDDPLDLTKDGFITGNGDRYAGGTTASTGTSTTAVTATGTKPGGVPGGQGQKPGGGAGPAGSGPDLSRPSAPTSRNWNCGFPPEADFDQVDYATVMITVTVGTDGRAKSVTVLSDPGHGFGRLARSCAMRMQYNPGFDRDGKPVVRTTSPFPVRFTR